MIPAAFEYHRPTSLDEAIGLLGQYGDDAKILAGGHSLVPLMKLRLAQPAHVIDLARIRDLSGIREEGGMLIVGALTTHYEIESSQLLKSKCPLLAETAACIGDVQVRNRGTIGGSAAHADPAGDYPAALHALEAEFVVQGSSGQRVISVADFFTGMLSTALTPEEILTRIRIPIPPAGTGASYQKFWQKASGFAICGVAALVTQSSGKCARARVGITGVAQMAYRAQTVESELAGAALTTEKIASAAAKAADGVDALSDLHASAEFRKQLAAVHTRRALAAAAGL
jgi:carbon-monoxide dehydrogenase medium subunit